MNLLKAWTVLAEHSKPRGEPVRIDLIVVTIITPAVAL